MGDGRVTNPLREETREKQIPVDNITIVIGANCDGKSPRNSPAIGGAPWVTSAAQDLQEVDPRQPRRPIGPSTANCQQVFRNQPSSDSL